LKAESGAYHRQPRREITAPVETDTWSEGAHEPFVGESGSYMKHWSKPAAVLTAVLGVMGCDAALAWGAPGHETVGAIADQLIVGTNAATQVKTILGADLNLSDASTWADCVKTLSVSGVACEVFATHGGKEEMTDFVNRNSSCERTAGDEVCNKQYHYTDVNLTQSEYKPGLVGVRNDDIVGAINAAVHFLKGDPVPAPFGFRDKHEALMALVHYVGDVHQPLHVGAVYLSAKGKRVDPDKSGFELATSTRGGNLLFITSKEELHGMWDDIPTAMERTQIDANWIAEAKAVAGMSGDVFGWSASWATDTLHQAKAAFQQVTFGPLKNKQWATTLPSGYSQRMDQIKKPQLTAAGAHLAQLLQSIWP
jgi:hypothetical protein